ncbi:SAP domain containing protein [Nitzschia inconspicua]|uniref:SAP domain containing protein n=1 Tax=Nitzschia inconspicua TaxID=303405 RepID=A0A9K3LSZ8_9STRA|nr:SAP domain containing protein [Nitzschia inconspicua]
MPPISVVVRIGIMLILTVASCVFKSSRGFSPSSSPAKLIKGSRLPTKITQQRLFASLKQQQQLQQQQQLHATRLYSSNTSDDVASMRAGEIKKELESYGISTASFVEKSELVEALEKARADGLKPKEKATTSSSSGTKKKRPKDEEEEVVKDTRPREERLKEELEKCQAMKAGELKKELQERGISTSSFFEKSDFVRALADARVDGIKKKEEEEGYAEYTNVEVLTDDSSGPRQRSNDSTGSRQQSSAGSSSPFGGASPFGAGMGGMGGMGGIADMLKNMGMGSTAAGGAGPGSPFGSTGANPFAGMGANPFGGMGGNPMGKAQEMMKNPKVMELIKKAQGNPKVMAAMQECMSNPAAFAKYQNDPEVSELIKELKKYV